MKKAATNKRAPLAAIAALLCALAISLAMSVTPAAAEEEGDTAPIRSVSESGLSIPEIAGPTAPERYPIEFEPSARQSMRQVSETEVVVEYSDGVIAFTVKAPLEHAADGANVPTTLSLSEGNLVTFIVHHRAGNPVAGGAPFAYPILQGAGWEGGFQTTTIQIPGPEEPKSTAVVPAPAPAPAEPTPSIPTCTVPALHGLSLHAAKVKLRAAHCTVGRVGHTRGVTAADGAVIRQSFLPGMQLTAGAAVAVKLAPR